MKRYVIKAATWGEDPDAEDYLSRTVYQAERQAVRTGLLDAHGNDIYMLDEPEPIGFIRWES